MSDTVDGQYLAGGLTMKAIGASIALADAEGAVILLSPEAMTFFLAWLWKHRIVTIAPDGSPIVARSPLATLTSEADQ